MPRQAVPNTRDEAPPGPFSPAVTGTPTLFVSGQVGQDPETDELAADDAAAQARQALTNLQAVLSAAGKTEADVIRVGVYLADMADYAAVNAVYAEFFSAPYPARTAIAVAALPLGALVEVDAVVG
jgi:2-iminobutanoate/2-iminopropanoate deaminase